jgi:ribosomal protein S27AE
MAATVTLFCPFCGRKMARRGSAWYCERGRTGIAKMVEDAIAAAMARTPAAPLSDPPPCGPRLFGYCPRCGEKMLTAAHATRVCPACGLSLPGGVFYALQEYHGHKAPYTAAEDGLVRPLQQTRQSARTGVLIWTVILLALAAVGGACFALLRVGTELPVWACVLISVPVAIAGFAFFVWTHQTTGFDGPMMSMDEFRARMARMTQAEQSQYLAQYSEEDRAILEKELRQDGP